MIKITDEGILVVEGNGETILEQFTVLSYQLSKMIPKELLVHLFSCALAKTEVEKNGSGDDDSDSPNIKFSVLTEEEFMQMMKEKAEAAEKSSENDDDIFKKMYGEFFHD